MAKITSNAMIDVTVIGSDGTPRTLKAGASDTLSYDSKHAHNQSLVRAGAISVAGREESGDSRSSAKRSASRRPSRKAAKAVPASSDAGSDGGVTS